MQSNEVPSVTCDLSGVLSGEALAKTEALAKGDGQLLAKFLQEHDEAAFEELVKRHAVMVMALCNRFLEDRRDAEEAFQNVFMVLARKAEMHLRADSIGGWLHHTVFRTAQNIKRARAVQARHFIRQENMELMTQPEEISAKIWESMKDLLDEELDRLAEKYRLPLILCYLEGKNTEEVAGTLRLRPSTLKMRLMRGRDLLRKRLVKRGVTVSAEILSTVLAEQVAQSAEVVSEVLIQTTVKSAMAVVSAAAGTTGIVAGGLKLLKGALLAMTMKQTAAIIGGLVLLGIFGTVPFLLKGNKQSASIAAQTNATVVANVSTPAKVVAKEEERPPSTAAQEKASKPPVSEIVKPVQKPVDKPAGTIVLPMASVQDFLQNLDYALALSNPAERWDTLRKMGINLTDEDFANLEISVKDYEKNVRHWKAGDFLNKDHQKIECKIDFQIVLYNTWVQKDPLSAVNWAYQFYSLPMLNDKTADVRSFTKQGNMLFLPCSMTCKDGKYSYQLYSYEGGIGVNADLFFAGLVKMWTVQDPLSAETWANNLLDDTGCQFALKAVAIGKEANKALYTSNPVEALNTLVANISQDDMIVPTYLAKPESEQGKVSLAGSILGAEVRAIAKKWMETDITSALAWAELNIVDCMKSSFTSTVEPTGAQDMIVMFAVNMISMEVISHPDNYDKNLVDAAQRINNKVCGK